jgi:hypothetical protein
MTEDRILLAFAAIGVLVLLGTISLVGIVR